MKRVIGIWLFSIYLLSSTECRQLLKLPILVQHFSEHQERNKDISLWAFMEMHYFGDDMNDNDQDRDMKLPFKSTSFTAMDLLTFSPESIFVFKPVFSLHDKPLVYGTEQFQSSFLSSIWQPPKAC